MSNTIKIISILFIFISTMLFGIQDSPKDIQNKIDNQSDELNKLRLEIEEIENRIHSQKGKSQNIEGILKELNSKIKLTEKLIRSLNKEEVVLSSKILETSETIKENRGELYALREDLTQQVRYLYKHGRSTVIEDLLTTKDINSYYYKQKYLNVITEYQKVISTQIDTIITELELQKAELNQNLARKKKIRNEKESENNNLTSDKNLKRKYLNKIKNDTKQLSNELDKQRKLADEINKMIQILISDKEKAGQREKELVKRRENKSQLGDDYFASMKGKLDWPVKGKILSKFGPNYNETTKTWSDNPGIDILANSGTQIFPVLDGLITTITFIRGFGNIIIIDHGGDYYSVYGNLESIAVAENEYVDESMKLAVIAVNPDDNSSLHFEVWGDFEKLNPEDWLK